MAPKADLELGSGTIATVVRDLPLISIGISAVHVQGFETHFLTLTGNAPLNILALIDPFHIIHNARGRIQSPADG